MKNIQPNVHQFYQLHTIRKIKMVQHQNIVSCGLKITWPVNKGFDSTFCVGWNSLPRLIMNLYDKLLHLGVVSMYTDSKNVFIFH